MIRAIGPLRHAWIYTRSMRLPRSGPLLGAPGNQLGALRAPPALTLRNRRIFRPGWSITWRYRRIRHDRGHRRSFGVVFHYSHSHTGGSSYLKLVRQGNCHSNPSSGHIPSL